MKLGVSHKGKSIHWQCFRTRTKTGSAENI